MTDQNGQPEIEYVDGAAIAARILRRYPIAQRARLLDAMTAQAPSLALKVQDKMYNIEEIKTLTNKSAQTLVREVAHKDLVAAVAGASGEVKEKLLSGMTERKREMVQEDTEIVSGTLKASQVKEAQWRLLEKLDELRERGAVLTQGKGGTWA